MREQMLSREDLSAAVFIGGMDGVKLNMSFSALPSCSQGAPRVLARRSGAESRKDHSYFTGKRLSDGTLLSSSMSIWRCPWLASRVSSFPDPVLKKSTRIIHATEVFYSFHYQRDSWRASKKRNIGV